MLDILISIFIAVICLIIYIRSNKIIKRKEKLKQIRKGEFILFENIPIELIDLLKAQTE